MSHRDVANIVLTYFAFVTRHPLTSQYSSSGVIESLNDLYLDLKSTKIHKNSTFRNTKISFSSSGVTKV